MEKIYPQIDTVNNISLKEFKQNYLGKKPLLIKGKVKDWMALTKWDDIFFNDLIKDNYIKIKSGNIQDEEFKYIKFKEYLKHFNTMDRKQEIPEIKETLYLHDIPIFSCFAKLREDVAPFPLEFFPSWYRYNWWQNIIFYYGGKHSVTPLHIDSLCTHNIFFQIKGKKRFIFILKNEEKYCYVRNYKYYKVDPENPDYETYPKFKNVNPMECIIEPGDMLYFHPVCLHQVRSLESSISINMDWHNKKSVVQAIPRFFGKMARSDIYYNCVCMLGLLFNVSPKFLHRFYRPYLGISDAFISEQAFKELILKEP